VLFLRIRLPELTIFFVFIGSANNDLGTCDPGVDINFCNGNWCLLLDCKCLTCCCPTSFQLTQNWPKNIKTLEFCPKKKYWEGIVPGRIISDVTEWIFCWNLILCISVLFFFENTLSYMYRNATEEKIEETPTYKIARTLTFK